MIDLHIKTPTEEVAKAAFPWFVVQEGEHTGQWRTASFEWSFCPIGPICLTPPIIDPETMEITTPAEMDEAFHANLLLFGDGEALAPKILETGFCVYPKNPKFVWG